MSHIFISYSKKNRDYALGLKQELLKRGFSAWIDEVIEPGDEWFEAIVKAIEDCATFVIIMTPQSKDSRWVRKEVLLAHNGNKPMFPLLRDGSNWPLFVDIQYEDVTGGDLPQDRFYEKLARHAPRMARGSDITPPQPDGAKTGAIGEAALPLLTAEKVLKIIPPPFEWCPVTAGQVTLEEGGYVPKGGKTFPVEAFEMAKYPVTNAQYDVFVREGYPDPQWWNYWTEATQWHAKHPQSMDTAFGGDDLPRTNVSWYDALAFCRWLSAKLSPPPVLSVYGQVGHPSIAWRGGIMLPTEQQWQRAAQGDDGRAYPWGAKFDKSRCNFNTSKPTPVTQYPNGESPFHVLDMSGNVWEWCLTDYDSRDSDINTKATYRVLRGGSWWYADEDNLRAAYRDGSFPDDRDFYRGFRLARS